jgi:cyclopropane fatty-acyl-phospholipid synthase-like methyltransferase
MDGKMELSKSAFFDTQVNSAWAAAPYTQQEHDRIDQVLDSAGLVSGMSVLEPGCGTGRLTDIMAHKVGPEGSVCAVDISKNMVERTSERMAAASNCRVVHAFGEEYVRSTLRYDLIVCHNMFHHFQKKSEALASLGGVLKQKGELLIFHFLDIDKINDPGRKIHPAVLQDTIPDLMEMESLFNTAGLEIQTYSNDSRGYMLRAMRNGAGE